VELRRARVAWLWSRGSALFAVGCLSWLLSFGGAAFLLWGCSLMFFVEAGDLSDVF
jgi:hypothetical protein